MAIWTRARSRRTPMVFTIELRRFFAAKIIQNWWLNIQKRKILRQKIENEIVVSR